MLQVIQSEFNGRSGTVIVQGDTQEEAMSTQARNLAIQEAGKNGLSRAGLSGGESVYPVDSTGVCSTDLMAGRGQVAGYRCDYRVAAGL